MIRILFVDDEARILDGIRRGMYCMRNEWQMRFASSGPAALEALAQEPADVVVSDMRMPNMDGSELLSEVMRLYPEAVRVVLSGQAEPESIVRATRAAHQYLSKPCDALALKAAIARTQSLKTILSDDRLATLVGSVDTLPSPPKAYQALLECIRDPASKLTTVIDVIRQDVAMTAKVVKLANSGFFGIRTPVQTVERSIGLIGIDAIATLVLGQQLFDSKQVIRMPNFTLERLGRHSFEVAAWARSVAVCEGLQALAHKRLEERSRQLLAEFRRQAAVLQNIEQHHPGLLELQLDDSGAILVDDADADVPVESLLRDIERSIQHRRQRLAQ